MRNIVLGFGLLMGLMLLSFSCSSTSNKVNEDKSEAKATTEVASETPTEVVAEEDIAKEKEQLVKITTDYGIIIIKLYNETPLHRDNFIKLAKDSFYNGTLFHRVIKGFMIQGGDPESKAAVPGAMYGNGGPGYTIPAEFNDKCFHKKGALAAARMGDAQNPERRSSGSQFYIVQGKTYSQMELNQMEQKVGTRIPPEHKEVYMSKGGTPFLDLMGYTVFGEVIMGFEIIDKIADVKTLQADRPEVDIKMTVELIEE